jgi:Protein of unknown function (DUF421)
MKWTSTFPRLRPLIHPPPLLLVQEGRLLRQNLRKEFITEEELMSQLREQGCEELSAVKKAYIEGDGRMSVIRVDGGQASQAPRRQNGAGEREGEEWQARCGWQGGGSAVQCRHPRLRPAHARTPGHGACPMSPGRHPLGLVARVGGASVVGDRCRAVYPTAASAITPENTLGRPRPRVWLLFFPYPLCPKTVRWATTPRGRRLQP